LKKTENSDASSKNWSRNWKNKSRRRRNVVEKFHSESKTFDTIDVGHYRCDGIVGCGQWQRSD